MSATRCWRERVTAALVCAVLPWSAANAEQLSFQGSRAALTLDASIPYNGAEGVSVHPVVELHFAAPITKTVFDQTRITLIGPTGRTSVQSSLDASAQKIVLRPQRDLEPAARYTVFIASNTNGNVSGSAPSLTSISFKTQTLGVTSQLAANPGMSGASQTNVADTPHADGAASALDITRLATGKSGAAQMTDSTCTNTQTVHGYGFCHEAGSVDGGIFRPGFANTNGRWRVNRRLPALPKASDFLPSELPNKITSVFGVVRRIDDQPVANVAVSLGAVKTRTDAKGRFVLTNVVDGHQTLLVNGATANRGEEEYGQFLAAIDIKPQQPNGVPFNLFVPRITARDKVAVPSPLPTDTVITHPAIPGLEIHLPAGAVLRDLTGKVLTQFAIVPMPVDRSPIPVPSNFQVYFSTQPGGATIEGQGALSASGLKVVYPNYEQAAAGEQLLYYYDAEHNGWTPYTKAHISTNARTIAADSVWGARTFMPEGGPPLVGNFQTKPNPDVTCEVQEGDPVDCGTGTFLHSATDLMINDVIPVALTHTYNSSDTGSRGFGRGTNHPYGLSLYSPVSTCDFLEDHTLPTPEIDLVTGDGRVFPFMFANQISNPFMWTGTHTASPTQFYGATLTATSNAITISLSDGSTYQFTNDSCPSQLVSVSDRFGNQVRVVNTAGLISDLILPSGKEISFSYNGNNEISQASDNGGRTVSYAYNTASELSSVSYPDGTSEQYTYDASGNMLTVVDRRGHTMVTNQYDANNRIIQQTYADGSVYHFAYTLSGSVVAATDVTDARGYVKHNQFNSAGYATSITRAYGTALAQTTTYARGAGQFPTSVTDPLGRVTTMTYDSAGDVLTRTFLSGTTDAATYTYNYTPDFHQISSIIDPLGHQVTYQYTSGCLTSMTDPLGNTSTITCNGSGQPLSVTDPLNHSTMLSYLGTDLNTVTDPLGRTTTFTVDDLGRVVAVRDPSGRLTRVDYDVDDRVTQSIDPLNQSSAYTYDGNGNLLSVTDPNGGTTQFAYDTRNRKTSRTDALNQVESWTYDGMGNALTYQDRKQQTTTYQYDALNRPSGVTYADASTITPTFDAGNRLIQVVDSVSGTIQRNYDGRDRLTQEQTPQGIVSYTYDAAGRRSTMSPGSQAQISYTYDNSNRLTQIEQGIETVAIAYDNADRRTTLTLPNGVVTSYTYDNANEVTGINYATASGTNLSSLTYAYDPSGRRLSQVGGFAPDVLPTATTGDNIFDLNNRQTKWNGVVLGYDSNGDPTTNTATNQTYAFDVRHRLTGIQQGGNAVASFSYDSFGRRTSKTIGASSTTFLYDGQSPVQETQASSIYTILTGMDIDERYARDESTGRYYYLTDALGSTLALTDGSGATKQTYAYEPYGEVASSGPSTNPYQYTGRENDETGLYYFRFRYYSPSLKRFISEDPLGPSAGLNGYGYALQNPNRYRDPLGLSPLGDITTAFCPGESCVPAGFGQQGWQPPPPTDDDCGCKRRLPDYVQFQIDIYVFSASSTYTKYGDVFAGGGFNRGYPHPVSYGVSIADGWMLKCNPTQSELNGFIDGLSEGFSAYGPFGGGYSTNSSGSGITVGVGIGVGFGGGVNHHQGNIGGL